MKISFNWIKDLVRLPSEVTVNNLAEKLTRQVVEIDRVVDCGVGLNGVVAGKIVEIADHPQAGRLGVASVDIGSKDNLTVIFGKVLPLQVGDIVPIAVAPCILATGVEVKTGAIRGVDSQGMVCVDEELGLNLDGRELLNPKHQGEKIHLTYLPKTAKPGTPLKEVLGLNDAVLEIDNVAIINRPDLWGHYGLAREAAALYSAPLASLKVAPLTPEKGSGVQVEIQTPLCRRYIGARVENITIQSSPDWLQAKLQTVGIRPINNIVDITNYVTLELGQPLHAFDAGQLKGDKIVVRQAKKGENIAALDEKTYQLPEGGLLICDGNTPAALAGIIGGALSQITNQTKSIILESANFDPLIIRKSSLGLGIRTEASIRFEKGLDPELTMLAMQRALTLIKKLCPQATLAGEIADEGEFKQYPLLVLEVTTTFISQRLGVRVEAAEISTALKPLGFLVKKGKKDSLFVTVPHWRGNDINIPEDIVEEVGRCFGYDRIAPQLPTRPSGKLIAKPIQNLIRQSKNLLSQRYGFTETLTYSFSLPSPIKNERELELANSPASDLAFLRSALLPNLLTSLAKNIRNFKQLALFEIGRVFRSGAGSYDVSPESNQHLPAQPRSLGLVLTDNTQDATTLFRQMKGVIEGLLQQLDYEPQWEMSKQSSPLAKWVDLLKTVEAAVNGETIGFVTMVPEDITSSLKIKQPVVVAELDLTLLVKLPRRPREYQATSKYPSIVADISLMVDSAVKWAEIFRLVMNFDKLITSCELFDVYEGKKIGDNKRSLAFHITFSSTERTLTDEEVKEVVTKLTATLKEKFKAEIR